MTVIAYKNGIMAADSACFSGDRITGHFKKILRLPDGTLGAAAGHHWAVVRFHDWLPDYVGFGAMCDPLGIDVQEGEFDGWFVRPGGDIFNVDCKSRVSRYAGDWFADGAPHDMAAGALLAGASAAEAVQICIAHHAYCGGDVQVEALQTYAPLSAQLKPLDVACMVVVRSEEDVSKKYAELMAEIVRGVGVQFETQLGFPGATIDGTANAPEYVTLCSGGIKKEGTKDYPFRYADVAAAIAEWKRAFQDYANGVKLAGMAKGVAHKLYWRVLPQLARIEERDARDISLAYYVVYARLAIVPV